MNLTLMAVITALVLLGGSAVPVVIVLHRPSWHPGDDTPEVPSDSPLRTWHT